jgi:phosphoglycerate dehydrogenase-like enzyme
MLVLYSESSSTLVRQVILDSIPAGARWRLKKERLMAEISTVLATVPYHGAHLERLIREFSPANLVQVPRDDAERVSELLRSADVAVIAGPIDQRFIDAPRLRWVHCDAAGIESSAWPEAFERGLMLTASAGRSAPVLAEHTLFLALSLIYDAHALHDAQRAHQWGLPGYSERRGLYGKTIGVVGLGATGRAVAGLASVMGMRVLGYGHALREPVPAVDEYFTAGEPEALERLLESSDVVVLACRLTDETYHLIGAEQLRRFKPSAYLINMARGAVIDEPALIQALRTGLLAGAGLDTFEKEPLPADSPLWDLPNVVITPHATPEMPDMIDNCLNIIAENVRRFRSDQPLINALSPSDAYTVNRVH